MGVTGSAFPTDNLKVLKGKISSLSPYALDQTLSVSGSAADAKAVGDALEKKVSLTDIVDNLNTNDAHVPLSAKQGVVLKQSITQLQTLTEEAVGAAQDEARTAKNTADSAKTAAEDAQNYANSAMESADGKISPDGSIPMTGDLDMGNNKIVNVAEPDKDTDAANKQYVDSRTFKPENVKLKAASWASTTGDAPYFQEVAVDGILATDRPHWGIVYSSDKETRQLEKEAFSLVDDLDTEDNTVIFTCWDARPETDLTIQMEVNR